MNTPENPDLQSYPSNFDMHKSPRSALIALLLCIFLGNLGIHRFYTGKILTGILMLLTFGGLGIWTLIDLVYIACGQFTDREGRFLRFENNASAPRKTVWAILGFILISVILIFSLIIFSIFYITYPLTNTVEKQLQAYRAGEYEQAYSYNSSDFQNETSLDEFKSFFDTYPGLKDNQSVSFGARQIRDDLGKLEGTVTSLTGKKTRLEYILIKEGENWKILKITVRKPGIAEEEKPKSKKGIIISL